MSNKTLTIGLLVTLVIAVCGLFFPQVSKLGFGGVSNGTDVTTTNYTSLSTTNGLANGGLFTTASRIAMLQATSTLCAIQSPNATSSLSMAGVHMTTSASYANTYELANDSTAFSSTTALVAGITVPANGTTDFISTTTSSSSVIPPSTWITLKLSTTSASATFAPVGTCTAEFKVL